MASNKPKQQIWGSRLSVPPDQLNIEFCAGRDVKSLPMADEVLFKYDIWTNLAHSKMLCKTGIISQEELKELSNALLDLFEKHEHGKFMLDPDKEDVHINIEHFITQQKGIEAGKKIHSGRSRNDQVATDMRLYLRDQLIIAAENLLQLIEQILNKAESEKKSIMPGFTHYQPAMITTAGHWMTAWSQALLRDADRITRNIVELNSSPLGAAASFGTSWAIDREYSSSLLGFEKVDENSLDSICSRGEYEAMIASNFSMMMNHLGTISQDIILLSTPYYDMLHIDDRYVTGSSIMPQKRNPDFAEVIRSKAAYCHGTTTSLLGILKGSMSGYNRDIQQSKYLIIDLFRECSSAPLILSDVCKTMTFKHKNMEKQCQMGFMNAADVADWMAQTFDLAFRECYEILSLAVKYSDEAGKLTHDALTRAIKETNVSIEITVEDVNLLNTPSSIINRKKHTGGPAVESVEKMIINQRDHLKAVALELGETKQKIAEARKHCFETMP